MPEKLDGLYIYIIMFLIEKPLVGMPYFKIPKCWGQELQKSIGWLMMFDDVSFSNSQQSRYSYGDVSKPILLYFEGWTSINTSYFWVHYATRVLTHSYHIITILLPSTILASPRFPSVCLGLCANTAEVGAKRAHAEAVVLRIDSGRKYVLRNLERRSNVEMSIQ